MSCTISCPSCQRTLRVPESLLGQAVKCPSCSHNFTAPDSTQDEAPPRPPRPSTAPPPPRDDYEDEPRPSRRRPRPDDDDDDDDDAPRRRPVRRDAKPGKVQAIGIMVLIGGIFACLIFLSVSIWAGLATFGLCCIPGVYGLVVGIMAIVKGAQLLGDKAHLQPAPSGIGIMMIINIINGDVVNLVLGILVLVFLSDPEVKDYFH
jgi:predicted Zn finger-like uncharacterized protein